MHDPSLVSIIIPTYNSAHYLGAALESVAAQDYRPIEVIVVDDGSSDETPAVVNAFFQRSGVRGQYRYQPNQGPAAARNHGLALARGAWVAFQDADDVWVPTKTVHQMQRLGTYDSAGIVWGTARPFRGDAVPTASCSDAAPAAVTMCLLQSMLIRRDVLDTVGGFDPSMRIGEDVDWLVRAMERAVQVVVDSVPAVYYRRHSANITSDAVMTRRSLHEVLKRSLDRRRQLGMPGVPPSLLVLPRPAHQGAGHR